MVLPIRWDLMAWWDWEKIQLHFPIQADVHSTLTGKEKDNMCSFVNTRFFAIEQNVSICQSQITKVDVFVNKILLRYQHSAGRGGSEMQRMVAMQAVEWITLFVKLSWITNLRILMHNLVRIIRVLPKSYKEAKEVDMQDTVPALDVRSVVNCLSRHIKESIPLKAASPTPFSNDIPFDYALCTSRLRKPSEPDSMVSVALPEN